MTWLRCALVAWCACWQAGCGSSKGSAFGDDPSAHRPDVDYRTGMPARNDDGTLNVVVEIPAGTAAKWEVGEDGVLRWEFRDGAPRVVRYLGYPGNYGMIPRTLSPKEDGGDGDPLDVILLAPSVARGEVVRARLIGVLALRDGGERDDKLLAVQPGTALGDVADIDELEQRFPGVTTILQAWFANYKGPGEIECRGFFDAAHAAQILERAEAAFAVHTGR